MLTRTLSTLKMLQLRGGEASKLELMKLMFLAKQGLDDNDTRSFYGFVPYHYGPYSFDLQRDTVKLTDQGYLLASGDKRLGLTDRGREKAQSMKNDSLARALLMTSMRNKKLSTDELLDKVYAQYPWYTVNTKRAGWDKPDRPVAAPAVYTVGYQGLQIDDFLDMLIRSGIQQLIDVRSNPVARRFGFHKSSLQRLLGHVGIDYLHVPQLGIPSSWRSSLENDADYRNLFARYTNEVLPAQGNDVQDIARCIRERPSVLMCMEEYAGHCHRTRLGHEVQRLTGLKVEDLRGGQGWSIN